MRSMRSTIYRLHRVGTRKKELVYKVEKRREIKRKGLLCFSMTIPDFYYDRISKEEDYVVVRSVPNVRTSCSSGAVIHRARLQIHHNCHASKRKDKNKKLENCLVIRLHNIWCTVVISSLALLPGNLPTLDST